jgi:hypothetical protein
MSTSSSHLPPNVYQLYRCIGHEAGDNLIKILTPKGEAFFNYYIDTVIKVHKDPVAYKSILNQILDYSLMCE